MPRHKNAVAVLYQVTNHNNTDAAIRLYPLLNCRYYHNVTDNQRALLQFTQQARQQSTKITFQNPSATILCKVTEGRFVQGINWVRRLHYRDESSRGEAAFDDCFQPGYFESVLPAQSTKSFAITCSVDRLESGAEADLQSLGATTQETQSAFANEVKRVEALLTGFYKSHPGVSRSDWLDWVLYASDSFVVKNRHGGPDVIAGYHWFEPWGRDTFISLPGLLLVTGRFGEAKEIFRSFISALKGGLIPNFIADKTGDYAYNTVDGTLWYINAVLQYIKYTGDLTFVRSELWSDLQAIIEHHRRGTMFGIRVDEDGLLSAWSPIDVDGCVCGRRRSHAPSGQGGGDTGALVQRFMRHGAACWRVWRGNHAVGVRRISAASPPQLQQQTLEPIRGCLFDVLEPKAIDASLRPNQILAVSLDYSMLNSESSRKVVEVVKQDLVTSYGLRTLSLDDPKFVGKCHGDRRSRDAAYHTAQSGLGYWAPTYQHT
jgi:predicted glycogen debranching enzyme